MKSLCALCGLWYQACFIAYNCISHVGQTGKGTPGRWERSSEQVGLQIPAHVGGKCPWVRHSRQLPQPFCRSKYAISFYFKKQGWLSIRLVFYIVQHIVPNVIISSQMGVHTRNFVAMYTESYWSHPHSNVLYCTHKYWRAFMFAHDGGSVPLMEPLVRDLQLGCKFTINDILIW